MTVLSTDGRRLIFPPSPPRVLDVLPRSGDGGYPIRGIAAGYAARQDLAACQEPSSSTRREEGARWAEVSPTASHPAAASAAAAAVSSGQGAARGRGGMNGSGPRGVACGGGGSCRPRSHGAPDPAHIIRHIRRWRKAAP